MPFKIKLVTLFIRGNALSETELYSSFGSSEKKTVATNQKILPLPHTLMAAAICGKNLPNGPLIYYIAMESISLIHCNCCKKYITAIAVFVGSGLYSIAVL